MTFWIVTPSYNQLEWLKMCIASVADQATAGDGRSALGIGEKRIEVHHHVQDALSSDGTQEFLKEHEANSSQLKANGYTFSYESISDNGMYDAINRGWKLASDDVDVIAHLNCDEQYLPNALKSIAEFMHKNPKADVVLADMIVVDKNGEYICHRRSLRPFSYLSKFCCAGSTATTFQRASVTKEKKVFFDTSWRNLGDKVWYNTLHQSGCRFEVCNQIVSIFADTGENLNWTDEGREEKTRYEKEFLRWGVLGGKWVSRLNGIRRYAKEFFTKSPLEYAIYQTEGQHRISLPIKSPRGVWHKTWGA